jgi:hypothetical protein
MMEPIAVQAEPPAAPVPLPAGFTRAGDGRVFYPDGGYTRWDQLEDGQFRNVDSGKVVKSLHVYRVEVFISNPENTRGEIQLSAMGGMHTLQYSVNAPAENPYRRLTWLITLPEADTLRVEVNARNQAGNAIGVFTNRAQLSRTNGDTITIGVTLPPPAQDNNLMNMMNMMPVPGVMEPAPALVPMEPSAPISTMEPAPMNMMP